MRTTPGPCVACAAWGAYDCSCMTDEEQQDAILVAVQRVASLSDALRTVLSVIDTRGFMTPEQQLVLARAREVLGK